MSAKDHDWRELWEFTNKKDRVQHCAKLLRTHYPDDNYLQVIAHALEGKNFPRNGPSEEQRKIGASVMLLMNAGSSYFDAVETTATAYEIGRTKVTECYKKVRDCEQIQLVSAVYKKAGEDDS